jgi:hypothetical protein
MKVEVRSVGLTLKVAFEKISLLREMEYVQDLIDIGSDCLSSRKRSYL